MERRKPINLQQAIQMVMKLARPGKVENIPLEESFGRFLAEDLVATHPVPPFDRSPYDGFAIRSVDTKNSTSSSPVTLEVVGEIGAGEVFTGLLRQNQAVRIMTGAPIPKGADAVVMLEEVDEKSIKGKAFIDVKRSVKPRTNISFTGEDTKKGTSLIPKGTYIQPGTVALLATFGYKYVPVSVKPKIGLITTGNEILHVEEPLQPGKIRNSNAYMTFAQILRAGGEPLYFGHVHDDFDVAFHAVQDALSEADILITTGGVSVGDYDYIPAIYEKLNAQVLFNKVAMRPGSVTTVAEKNGKLLFGLSGNPSACYVGFELFVRPVIRTFLHSSKPYLKKITAKLGTSFPKANPFDRFVRAKLTFEKGDVFASPVGLDKSNVVSSLALANALIFFPKGSKKYEKEMNVDVLYLEDQEGSNEEQFFTEGTKQHERSFV
jgi:molybdopterin molybdotransferase